MIAVKISGAGVPAKMKNDVNADGVYIFFGKSTTLGKDERTMGQIKRNWFKTIFLRHERGFDYDRWKEKIQI